MLAAMLAAIKLGEGHRVLYAVPQMDQANNFWREVKAIFAEKIDDGTLKKNETERTLEYEGTEQRIRCKTAWNADSLRGDYADVLILDEYQLMSEDAWEFVGAPMLLDHDGEVLFIYTPPNIYSRSVSKARDPRHAAKMFKSIAAKAKRDPARWLAVHFTSHDNTYISASALEEISADMTALAYKQEIMAEDVDEVPGAQWKQSVLDASRIDRALLPVLTRIVVGIDPPGSEHTEAGIVAAGIDRDDHRYVIADRSLLAPSPEAWASAAVILYHELKADLIVGERNYGGDMVEATIRQVDPNVAYRDVVATRGKLVRAQPIAAAWEKGRAHMAGTFPELETELCSYVPGNASPNRLDAMVWATTELEPLGRVAGWIEYLKQYGHEALQEVKTEWNSARQQAHEREIEIQKQILGLRPPQTDSGCPACGSACIIFLNTGMHCNQCRHDWVPNGRPEVVVAGFLPDGRPGVKRLQ